MSDLTTLYNSWWSTLALPYWKRLGNSNLGELDTTIRQYMSTLNIIVNEPNITEIQKCIIFFKFYFLYLQEIFPIWATQKPEVFAERMRHVFDKFGNNVLINDGPEKFLDVCIEEINNDILYLVQRINIRDGTTFVINFDQIYPAFFLWICIAMFKKTPFSIEGGQAGCVGVEKENEKDDCSPTNPPFLTSISESDRETYISYVSELCINPFVFNSVDYVNTLADVRTDETTVIYIILFNFSTPPPVLNSLRIVALIRSTFDNFRVISEPFETTELCVRHSMDISSIYLLRMQVNKEFMDVIERNYDIVLQQLSVDLQIPPIPLIRLGYFNLIYNPVDTTIQASLIEDISIHNAKASVTPDQFLHLSNDQFEFCFKNREPFNALYKALISKTYIEQLFRQDSDKGFNIYIALDLYANRSLASSHMFHKDATPACPTNFFTLTYLLKNNGTKQYDPALLIKGPTVVTATDQPNRTQSTLVIRHGSTIGIDNRVVLHATSDAIVRLPITCEKPYGETYTIPVSDYNSAFNLITLPQPKYISADTRAKAVSVEQCTQYTTRSFVRTWFIPAFPNDKNPIFIPIINGSVLRELEIFNVAHSGIKLFASTDDPDTVMEHLSPYTVGGKRYQKGGACIVDINKSTKSKEYFNKIVDSTENFSIGSLQMTGGMKKKKNYLKTKNRKTKNRKTKNRKTKNRKTKKSRKRLRV